MDSLQTKTPRSRVANFTADEKAVLAQLIKKRPEDKKNDAVIRTTREQVRRPIEYIRREAVMRLRNLENKKKLEIRILKTQLKAEQIKKRTALIQEDTNKCLLEKAKRAALVEEEINKCLLEKAKKELEEVKKLVAKQVVTD